MAEAVDKIIDTVRAHTYAAQQRDCTVPPQRPGSLTEAKARPRQRPRSAGARVPAAPRPQSALSADLAPSHLSLAAQVGGDLLVNEVVTAPYDPRFPATNQARHCFVRYNEYYK